MKGGHDPTGLSGPLPAWITFQGRALAPGDAPRPLVMARPLQKLPDSWLVKNTGATAEPGRDAALQEVKHHRVVKVGPVADGSPTRDGLGQRAVAEWVLPCEAEAKDRLTNDSCDPTSEAAASRSSGSDGAQGSAGRRVAASPTRDGRQNDTLAWVRHLVDDQNGRATRRDGLPGATTHLDAPAAGSPPDFEPLEDMDVSTIAVPSSSTRRSIVPTTSGTLPVDDSSRVLIKFVADVPGGMPAATIPFNFLGVLHTSVQRCGGQLTLTARWSSLQFGASPPGDLVHPPERLLDMVDFGIRLIDAHPSWAVAAVVPLPKPVIGTVSTTSRDVNVSIGPGGLSVSRGAGAEVAVLRAPYALAAGRPGGDALAVAAWRWELKALDNGSPYYTSRPSARTPPATQGYMAEKDALSAVWTVPEAAVGHRCHRFVTVEAYVHPRFVTLPRRVLGVRVRPPARNTRPRATTVAYTHTLRIDVTRKADRWWEGKAGGGEAPPAA